MPEPTNYEVYAIRYARHDRRASENFLGGDPHDGPMPVDYFVWGVGGGGKIFGGDPGFGSEQAVKRKRELIRSPADGLRSLGIDPARVEDGEKTHKRYER